MGNEENGHYIFYRDLIEEAFRIAPNVTMKALYDEVLAFSMPGAGIPNFQQSALQVAAAGIYNPPIHVKYVLNPVLRYFNVFEREDLSGFGAKARDDLAEHVKKLHKQAALFTEKQTSGQLAETIQRLKQRSGQPY